MKHHSPATHAQGKPQAIARIRRQYPYNNVVVSLGAGFENQGMQQPCVPGKWSTVLFKIVSPSYCLSLPPITRQTFLFVRNFALQMIGDGITDQEAVEATGGADIFICYGGVVERQNVASRSDWFVRSYDDLMRCLKRYKVRRGQALMECSKGNL
eukprot:1159870-Pelagomonas_calceolata.AAC.9